MAQGSFENEDRSTKHPNLENETPIENEALENEAPKSRERGTQKLENEDSETDPKNWKTKTPKLETGLSFINTRQSLSNTAGIKHDNESNSAQIYSSKTVRCCKCISAAAWEAMFWKWSENRERPNYF